MTLNSIYNNINIRIIGFNPDKNIRKVGVNMLGNFAKISDDTINGLKEIILSVYKYSFFSSVDNFEENLKSFMKNTQITLVEKETILSVLYQIIIFNKAYLGDNYQWTRNMTNKIGNNMLLNISHENYKSFLNECNNYLARLVRSESDPISTINYILLRNVNNYNVPVDATLRVLKNNIIVRSEGTLYEALDLEERLDNFIMNKNLTVIEKGNILSIIYQLVVLQFVYTGRTEEEKVQVAFNVLGDNFRDIDSGANYTNYIANIDSILTEFTEAVFNPRAMANKKLEEIKNADNKN